MSAVLATLAEVKSYLGVSSTTPVDFPDVSAFDTYLQDLVDNVEAILSEECAVEFAAAGDIADEARDGTGTDVIYSKFPIATLTSVKTGIDSSAPDETLDSIPDEVDSDGRRVIRRGGCWQLGLKNIYLTYATDGYAPRVAKQALLEGSAFLYRRRGKEHVSSQTIGEMGSIEAAARFDFLPAWTRAKTTLRVPVIV